MCGKKISIDLLVIDILKKNHIKIIYKEKKMWSQFFHTKMYENIVSIWIRVRRFALSFHWILQAIKEENFPFYTRAWKSTECLWRKFNRGHRMIANIPSHKDEG